MLTVIRPWNTLPKQLSNNTHKKIISQLCLLFLYWILIWQGEVWFISGHRLLLLLLCSSRRITPKSIYCLTAFSCAFTLVKRGPNSLYFGVIASLCPDSLFAVAIYIHWQNSGTQLDVFVVQKGYTSSQLEGGSLALMLTFHLRQTVLNELPNSFTFNRLQILHKRELRSFSDGF